MPSARSSDSAPVGIASTFTWAPSSPMRMTVPLPNWRSICASAPCRAASRALASWVLICCSCGLVTLGLDEAWGGIGRNAQRRGPQRTRRAVTDQRRSRRAERLVSRAVRMQARDEQRQRVAAELERLGRGRRPRAAAARAGRSRATVACARNGRFSGT